MPGGCRYFLLLIDGYICFMWLVLLTSKDEAAMALKRFQAEAQTEARRKLRTLCTNRGNEFTSNELVAHFVATGVKRHLTAPYSPQQNSVVESRNRTVVGMARCSPHHRPPWIQNSTMLTKGNITGTTASWTCWV
jgi:transposase InsO family protein